MSDAAGHALALLLAIPPEFALACLNSERAKTPELRETWKNTASMIARSLSKTLLPEEVKQRGTRLR
jgi:hypothetical protein